MTLEYYDKILAGIGVSLAIGTVTGFFTQLPIRYTVGAGAAISMGLMYHGMFMNGPE